MKMNVEASVVLARPSCDAIMLMSQGLKAASGCRQGHKAETHYNAQQCAGGIIEGNQREQSRRLCSMYIPEAHGSTLTNWHDRRRGVGDIGPSRAGHGHITGHWASKTLMPPARHSSI